MSRQAAHYCGGKHHKAVCPCTLTPPPTGRQMMRAAPLLVWALICLPEAIASGSSLPPVRSWACAPSLSSQQHWTLVPAPNTTFSHLVWGGSSGGVSSTRTASPLVLTPLNGSDSTLGVLPMASPAYPAQLWALQKGLLVSGEHPNRCAASTAPVPGLLAVLVPCNATDSRQAWEYDAPSGSLRQAGLIGPQCLDVGSRLTCASPEVAALPFCNVSAPPQARALDLAGRLTAWDLQSMLGGWYVSQGVPRLGLNAFSFAEALHGLGDAGCGHKFSNASWSNSGCATSFPHAPLLAATFNASLWGRVGEAIGVEARASGGGLLLWTPDINGARDARWGRAQEVPGSDVLLTGAYAAAFVNALQRGVDGTPHDPLRAVATCKHWAAYDLEGRTGANNPFPTNYSRHTFSANISRKDLAEYFFPPMQDCVGAPSSTSSYTNNNSSRSTGAGALSVMSSINSVNGVPGAANAAFTVDQLRGQWAFPGFVTSDCGTVSDLLTSHHYVSTPPGAVAAALSGGTDSNCGHFYNTHLVEAVEGGLVTLGQAQGAAARLLGPVFALGLGDPTPPSPFAGWGPERMDTPTHRALALEGALQGIVLLRNTGGILPLRLGTIHSLAILGPHLNASTAMLSNYAGDNTLCESNTPYLRLGARAAAAGVTVRAVLGVPTPHSNATEGIPQAVAAASASDAAVVFLGLDQVLEREGLDRVDTLLPGAQRELLAALAVGAPHTPLVVVLMGGGAISEAALGAQALVVSGYPGELGGEALAAVLVGEVGVSGRLPYTIPTPSWGERRDIRDMALAPHTNASSGAPIPGATHWYMDPSEDVLFPFGAGLLYTSVEWSWSAGSPCDSSSSSGVGVGVGVVSVDAGEWAASVAASGATPPGGGGGVRVSVGVHVENTGGFTSDVSVLGFVSSGRVGEPRQKLFGFGRVAGVKAGGGNGSAADLSLLIPPQVVALVDSNGTRTLTPGVYTLRVGGDAGGGGILCSLNVTGVPTFMDALAF